MSDQKIVVVFGATGVQGGSVIKSLQNDPVTAKQFKIRGITRDPFKPAVEALKKQGVECVTVGYVHLFWTSSFDDIYIYIYMR